MVEKKPAVAGRSSGFGTRAVESLVNSNIQNIPQSVYTVFEKELQNLEFGGVSLIATVRDGKLSFRIEKVISLQAE